MLNPEEVTSQEGILEETNEENSEAIRLQLRENSSQDISKSELAKMEKWMNEVVYSNYVMLSLGILANVSFSLTSLTAITPIHWHVLFGLGLVLGLLTLPIHFFSSRRLRKIKN